MAPLEFRLRYLYLAGLHVPRAIPLQEGVELLPASPPPALLDSLRDDPDLTRLGLMCLYLPFVGAQFHISCRRPQDFAPLTQNCMWDALLMGALFDRSTSINLQSDVPLEEVKSSGQIDIASNHRLPTPNSRAKSLQATETAWICRHYTQARHLLSSNMAFTTSTHCLASHAWHASPRAQLTLLWSGIEALFAPRSGTSLMLCQCISRFLHPADEKLGEKRLAAVRRLYAQRSTAVHGCEITQDTQSAVRDSAELLRTLLFRCVETDRIPDRAE
ncbi:hypothetical protein DA2_2178 [Desulfovibrio sp. A2]|nr:hypothetical protein DA2_2178 [Desulfovibrio sp. A2]